MGLMYAMDLKYPLITYSRLRINQDGDGVFTLVAGANCELSCDYCINKPILKSEKFRYVTPEELYEKVKIDNLYFLATNGGVTFGGGEPLLYPDFINKFAELVDKKWHINVETSLNVPKNNLIKMFGTIDMYYVDIKDCNDDIYMKYTGKHNNRVMKNLRMLYEAEGKNKTIIRVPLIKGYNTQKDISESVKKLKKIGFDNFDCFTYLLPEEQQRLKEKNKENQVLCE